MMKGEPLEWRRRCISYAVDAGGSESMALDTVRRVVAHSFSKWTGIRCDGQPTDVRVAETERRSMCTHAGFNRKGGNVNTIAFVSDWSERGLPPEAFALTTVTHNPNTGQIFDADIQVNEQLGPYAICPSRGCPTEDGRATRTDLPNVLIHEVGHFFGLGHSEQPFAAMAASARRGETTKRFLRLDDKRGFCAAYPPGSLPRECNFAPEDGLALKCGPDTGSGGGGGGCTAGGSPRQRSGSLALAFILAFALDVRRRRTG